MKKGKSCVKGAQRSPKFSHQVWAMYMPYLFPCTGEESTFFKNSFTFFMDGAVMSVLNIDSYSVHLYKLLTQEKTFTFLYEVLMNGDHTGELGCIFTNMCYPSIVM
jgi:hypothetical protein